MSHLKFSEFLKELAKPSGLGQMRSALSNYKTVDTRDPSWQGKVEDIMQSGGFKHLGSGKYSTVFEKPGLNYIVKIFMKDAAFLIWYKFCLQHPNNPYCPKFRGKIVKINDNFFALRMEKLKPLTHMFSMSTLEQLSKDDAHALEVFEFLKKHKQLLDLHGENSMERGDGHPVIIDCFYNWFLTATKSYTIDPNDFDISKI